MNLSSDNIIAYFQPILSADSDKIYSYEILGRFIDENGAVQSLGDFFNNPNTSNEDALRVDRIVRRYAMKKYAEEKRSEYLFINIRLVWLLRSVGNPKDAIIIQWAKEFGISYDKLVIEITEEEFNSDEAYIDVISYFKNIGCRIALDDYGKSASNIDRLAMLKPDIIKINIDYIHNAEKSYHYREYLRSLADFADSVGIEVLYEGIETQQQLDFCMSLHGRYFQGFLIARPQPSMCGAVINNAVFCTSLKDAYTVQWDTIVKFEALRKSLEVQVERFLAENTFYGEKTDYYEFLTKLCQELKDVRFVYLCSRRGDLLAYKVGLQSESIDVGDYEPLAVYQITNWAWRVYFYDTLKSIAAGQKSCLSAAYHDFATKIKVRTYSYAISDDAFLFLDFEEI